MDDVRIDFTDRHQHHADSVRDYAEEKVGKLHRYFDKVQHIEIVLDQEHGEHTAEVIVTANQHMRFVGHASNESALASIDRAVEKLEKQVLKAKERMKDHHRGETPFRQP